MYISGTSMKKNLGRFYRRQNTNFLEPFWLSVGSIPIKAIFILFSENSPNIKYLLHKGYIKMPVYRSLISFFLGFRTHSAMSMYFLCILLSCCPHFLIHIIAALFRILWHFRLWSFQGRDTKLERFLARNQLYSNEITKF